MPPQVIQGLVIGRLCSRFSEAALLRASVLVFSVVGLAMVSPGLHPWDPPSDSALRLSSGPPPPPPRAPLWGLLPYPLGAPITVALPTPCQALMSNVFHFCLLMPGLVFGLCTLNVVTDSMLTKAVSASDTGERRLPAERSPGPSGGTAVLLRGRWGRGWSPLGQLGPASPAPDPADPSRPGLGWEEGSLEVASAWL